MGRPHVLHLLLVLITGAPLASASNILGLFPHPGYSHFKVYYPILRALAERGHNVTAVTYITSPDRHPNYNEKLIVGPATVNAVRIDTCTPTRTPIVLLHEYLALHNEGQASCKAFYESRYVTDILQSHEEAPYDLVITEFFNTDCYLGVPYLLRAPVVGLSSCILMPWIYDRILLPDTPSYVQSEFVGFPEQLNWHQRLLNFLQAKLLKLLYRYYTNHHDGKLIAKYLNVTIDVDDFAKRSTNLVLVNQHYTLSGNRPLTQQLIEIGGIHIQQQHQHTQLPPLIEEFLETSNEDVLFISWGSMVRASSIAPTKVQHIVEVLQSLPLKVIWKWETEEVPSRESKFLFVDWAPQLALLCHPKVKYFWGHGGLLGVTEATHCGKPMILTPIYGDQFVNAHAVVNRGFGLIMPYNDIAGAPLQSALKEIMQTRYTQNAAALSRLFRNRKSPPLETAVWWIEHLLEHGAMATAVLQPKAVHLSWYEYHSLDCIVLLLVLVVLPLWLVKCAQRCLPSSRRRRSKVKAN